MATSLYDLSVPTFLQTVKAVGGFLDRAARHCSETRADLDDFVHARLFDDMARPRRLVFTSETLILSFSLPNFYFHAVTAYNILRTRGVPLGKRDYEGQLRTRTA